MKKKIKITPAQSKALNKAVEKSGLKMKPIAPGKGADFGVQIDIGKSKPAPRLEAQGLAKPGHGLPTISQQGAAAMGLKREAPAVIPKKALDAARAGAKGAPVIAETLPQPPAYMPASEESEPGEPSSGAPIEGLNSTLELQIRMIEKFETEAAQRKKEVRKIYKGIEAKGYHAGAGRLIVRQRRERKRIEESASYRQSRAHLARALASTSEEIGHQQSFIFEGAKIDLK